MLAALSCVWLGLFAFILLCHGFHEICMAILRRKILRLYWLVAFDERVGGIWLRIIERMDLFDPARTRRDLEEIRAMMVERHLCTHSSKVK